MRIRLLALDIDGTLLTSHSKISPASRVAIQALVARGVHVVLASARSPSALRSILAELNLEGYVVAFTGGLLCRLSPNPTIPIEIISEQHLALTSAYALVRRAQELGISIGWYGGETWHISTWDAVLRREADIIKVQPLVTSPLTALVKAPHKIQCMVGSLDQVSQLQRLRSELPADCTGQFSHQTYLEIIPKGVDKAVGLRHLGQRLDLELAEMAAIGDGENDIAMLQSVGLGIAMGNASLPVREAATWLTTTNNQDGVAAAIERLHREGYV